MKIIKYQKLHNNEYKIYTEKEIYKLYDDIIIKYELLIKKELKENELKNILAENELLAAYYTSLKAINTRLRTEKELATLLKKQNYTAKSITYSLERLNKEGYLNHKVYIEAYIHDRLNLYLEGEQKIKNNLLELGFLEEEITPLLDKVDKKIYLAKITKYLEKKAKTNKSSIYEFKHKILNELLMKGFLKEDINSLIENLELEENNANLEKLINKLTQKYLKKYDLNTTKLKIKAYLYQKGYSDINSYLDNIK